MRPEIERRPTDVSRVAAAVLLHPGGEAQMLMQLARGGGTLPDSPSHRDLALGILPRALIYSLRISCVAGRQ